MKAEAEVACTESEEDASEEGDSELGSSIELLGSFHEDLIDHNDHYAITSPSNPTHHDVGDAASTLETVDNNLVTAKLATTTTTAGATDVFCFDIGPTLEKGKQENFTTSTDEVNGDDGRPADTKTNARAAQNSEEGDQSNNSDKEDATTSIEKRRPHFVGWRDKLLIISLAIIAAQGDIILSYKYQQQHGSSAAEKLGPLSGVEQKGRADIHSAPTTPDDYEHNRKRQQEADEDTVLEPPLPPSGEPPSSASTKSAAIQRYMISHKEVLLALEMMQDEVKSIKKKYKVNGDGPSTPIKVNKVDSEHVFFTKLVILSCFMLADLLLKCKWPGWSVEDSSSSSSEQDEEEEGDVEEVLPLEEAQLHAESLVQLQLEKGRKEMKETSTQPTKTANHDLQLFDSWQKDSREACDISHMATLRSQLVDELYESYENTRLEANLELQTDVANKRHLTVTHLVDFHLVCIIMGGVIAILGEIALDYFLHFNSTLPIGVDHKDFVYENKLQSCMRVMFSQLGGIIIAAVLRLQYGLKKEKDYPKLDFLPPGSKVELVATQGEGDLGWHQQSGVAEEDK